MSKRQWLVLLMLFLGYLLLGATIFYLIESPLEEEKIRDARIERVQINELLNRHYRADSDLNHSVILKKLGDYCGKVVGNYTETVYDYKWDFYNSFYFAYTVVSTIGYGNLAPTNMLGRILMIFYGLIGIPMNGILLAQLGEFFGNVFVRAHKKYKAYKEGNSDTPNGLNPLETRRAGLAVQIFFYLTPGFIMFIFFPAFLFSYFEGWQYDESVYYAFVTLTTIGFGDYVAGQDNTKGIGRWPWWIIYKIFLILWISFGLGYLVMIMSFIARGMRSKRIARLEHKLAANLKYTQTKILQEFNKDINYLRRVFNEVYLMKLKPVYRDDYDAQAPLNTFPRSCSFPDLRELIYGGREAEIPIHPRRRANSAVAEITQYEAINRAVSETDLHRIDKKATFASHAIVQPGELLAHLVTAMGYIPPAFDDIEHPKEEEEEDDQEKSKGVDGFSDKDILASEKPWAGSGWRIGEEKMPAPRMRAASEIGLTKDRNGFGNQHNSEWTWSGPAASKKLQELIKARKNDSNQSKESKSRLPSFSFASVPKNIRPRWFNPFSSKKNSGEMSRSDSLPVDDIETTLRENYLSHTTNTRPLRDMDRRRSAAPHYFTHTGGNLPNTPEGNLLEETSLADFLRALTSLHSRVGAVPEDFVNRPQRKMGTASLTPPKLPSLLALFSPPPGFNSPSQSTQSTITAGQNAARRFSLRPVENSGSSTPSYQRRGSLISGSGHRRFSMKPEDSSGTSTPAYQRRGSLIPTTRPRRFSLRNVLVPGRTSPQNSPPYTADMVPLHINERRDPPPYSADPFIFECPKEPLVSAEVGPAQDGIPRPIRATPVPRRFSLRPAQIGVPPAPPLPKASSTSRPVPKWKGGMLERQIGELSLQRRVRAFSLSDVHSIRNDRTVGPTSPLALPNATAHLSTIFASRPTSTTENTNSTSSQAQDKTAMVIPSGILSRKTIDARQTTGSIDQSSTGQKANDKMPMSRPQQPVSDTVRTGLPKPEKLGAVDLTHFVEDQRGSDEAKMATAQSSNPFNLDILARQSSALSQTPNAYEAVYTAARSGQLSTAGKLDAKKIGMGPFATDSSHSSELQFVVVDEPLSKRDQSPHFSNNEDLLSEVKVDSVKTVNVENTSGESAGQLARDSDVSGRKISVISQKSSRSVGGATSDGEKCSGRKISQQSIELGSMSGSRKSSSSKLDKPRISIESYKPLMELKIEKPLTNPFEQYKATVECKLNKPREISPDLGKTSIEMKGDGLERIRHSTPAIASSASEQRDPKV